MKRYNIWILTGIVAVCFIGLLLIQTIFVNRMVHERSNLFDQIVNNCIARVIQGEETDEMFREEPEPAAQLYWGKMKPSINISERLDLTIIDKNGETNGFASIKKSYHSYGTPELLIPNKKGDQNNIDNRSKALNRQSNSRLQNKRLNAQKLLSAEDKSIDERLEFSGFKRHLQKEFCDNGIYLPFQVAVINHRGDTVYKDSAFVVESEQGNFKRFLFPNDIQPKAHFASIYFPDKKSYIFQSLQLAIPSFIIATILVLTIIVMIYILFKQKRLSEIKNDFINNMTHEFKTPISTISLASQMLKDSGVSKTPQSLGHISRVIHDETKRLGFQVDKVLQMAIFDKDKSRLKFQPQDVNDLVYSVLSNFSIKVDNRNGSLTEELDAQEAVVYVDELHFTNVIYNLLDNALKYCHRDPELHVRTWNEKQKLCISVKDNGIGIKKEDVKRVFEKFYRVPTGNVHNVKGFGLGLAYVKKIVDDHQGSMRVESELNIGTTFIICLPLKRP